MILNSTNLSATTAEETIFADIDYLCKSNSTAYPLAAKLRNCNLAYYVAVTAILRGQSNWEWDDTNATDFPVGTTNLVANQLDYALPTDFLKVLRVEAANSAGVYIPLTQFDEQQVPGVSLSSFMSASGTPIYYREIGNSIELYPKSAAAVTNGLRVYYQRLPASFTNASAATEPGFTALFHRAISLGAALDYASVNGLQNKEDIRTALNEMLAQLSIFYSKRNRSVRPTIVVKRRNYD